MFRATTKEGKVVEGYWFVSTGSLHPEPVHYIIVDKVHDSKSVLMEIGGENFACYRIDPQTLAQDTTKRDKNGTKIFGSFPVEGVMTKGGDRVRGFVSCYKCEREAEGIVAWDKNASGFFVEAKSRNRFYAPFQIRNIKVIGQEDKQ